MSTTSNINIKKLNANDENFQSALEETLAWDSLSSDSVNETVDNIIANVRAQGDSAILNYTKQFDNLAEDDISRLKIAPERLKQSLENLPQDQAEALRDAASRIRTYHEKQKQDSWQYSDPDGSVYGQKITPLDRVGIYVPGGKASYPSTVLMDAIPARVAGVKNIVATVPTPNGEVNELVLAALSLAEVDEVFTIGGAQAIAAMAYGTESIARVDKIVGPGNIFVATAKKKVFGQVGIDMVAGPSEILVICDGSTDPQWVAMDLFSQAEHDEDAQSILVSTDSEFTKKVEQCLNELLPTMERREIITESLVKRGCLIQVESLEQAAEVCNLVAPEHVELSVADPDALLPLIRHAGAIFMGAYTSESLGDYCAGPSHVLPTSGTARFSSALGVYDFQKRSSIIHCSEKAAKQMSKTASVLARSESLTAHARSAEFRNPEEF